MTKRPLTEEEKTQMSIVKNIHQEQFQEKLNLKFLILPLFLEILSVLAIYYYDVYSWTLITKCIVVAIPIYIWVRISGFQQNKKYSKDILAAIERLENLMELDITKYNSHKAVLFEDYNEEFPFFAMEVGNNQLLFFLASEEERYLLPNTDFEIINNEEYLQIFGYSFKTYGNSYQPIKIKLEKSTTIQLDFEKHLQVIETNVNDYFRKIENETSKSVIVK